MIVHYLFFYKLCQALLILLIPFNYTAETLSGAVVQLSWRSRKSRTAAI